MENTWLCLTLLATLAGAATAANCWDCWYHTVTGYVGDTDCNEAGSLSKVKNETCDGECYTIEYTLGFAGVYVKRGCEKSCKPEYPYKIKGIGNGNKTCCPEDFCNNKIISDATINQASVLISGLVANAILFYNTAL